MAGTLFDSIKKSYKVSVKCTNCHEFAEISVPKGVTIEEFMKSEKSKCPSCGCNTLEKYTFPKTKVPEEAKASLQPRIVFEGPRKDTFSHKKR
jgi:NAD-dependent SIR2 family protein deacetylase